MITLGTRGSDLARWQTNYVLNLLQQAHHDLKTEVQVFVTQGDKVLDKPLPQVGGKGLFTAELESALRGGSIDVAVHSLKDLPTEQPEGLALGAIPVRANPADVLVSREGFTLETLSHGATIGTSSRRRAAQLRHLRPDLQIKDIRGNVDTRIRKALEPELGYDAVLLAYAGLDRLELTHFISQVLPLDVMLPAPGQGALGVQCRDDELSRHFLKPLHHHETALAVTAERAFLSGLGGGCSLPIAAYARRDETGKLRLDGRVNSADGATQIDVNTFVMDETMEGASIAGIALAQEALMQGARALLAV